MSPGSIRPSSCAGWRRPSRGSASGSTSGRPSARSSPGALTPGGAVAARWVVRPTEGYTAGLRGSAPGARADEQLDGHHRAAGPSAWDEIGWQGCEVIGDEAHVYVYLQRTADGRIAIGGRGVPYRFGSRTDGRATARHRREPAGEADGDVPRERRGGARSRLVGGPGRAAGLVRLDPADPVSGLARAGGYVGEGVAAANLAGRTLRDLILGADSELTRCPGSAGPAQLGAGAAALGLDPQRLLALPRADAAEARSGRPSRAGCPRRQRRRAGLSE